MPRSEACLPASNMAPTCASSRVPMFRTSAAAAEDISPTSSTAWAMIGSAPVQRVALATRLDGDVVGYVVDERTPFREPVQDFFALHSSAPSSGLPRA